MSSDCKHCGRLISGPFCSQCGQRHIEHRWTSKILFGEFLQQITNIERGFLYTAKSLFTQPGRLIRQYWKGDTVRTYHPFRYLLIWLAINILINFWLGIDDLLQQSLQPEFIDEQFDSDRIAAADQRFDTWLNGLVLLLLPFFAGITYYLFKTYRVTYGEHLIMNAFMMGQQSLITSFTHFLFYFMPGLFSIYIIFNFAIGLGYNTYVFTRVFNDGLWKSMGKAFLMGVLGLLVFGGIIALASTLALIIQ